jgi:hypothetical protein
MQGVQARSKSVRAASSWRGQQEYQTRILETVDLDVEKGTVPRDEDARN